MVKKLRLQHGWSQEQLSQFSGLSVRTIQRIEQGKKPGLESLKSLAAVFDIHIMELQQETEMNNESNIAFNNNHGPQKSGFLLRLIVYVVVIAMLFVLNLLTNPTYIWAWWPAMGWGIGIVIAAVRTTERRYAFARKQ